MGFTHTLRHITVTAAAVAALGGTARAQYNGKYVGWSAGYIFTGTLSQVNYKCYTHLFNFQVTLGSGGSLGTGNLAVGHSSFVSTVKGKGLKTILCIGGAGQSKNFSAAVANPATQTKLVNNILAMVRQNGYDGVDLDWECGEENDGAAMVTKFKAFHKEIRDSIDKMTPRPLFTAAVSTDWYPNASASIGEYLDQMNNMSYYNYVKDMDRIFKPVLDKGVPKKIMGVGFGFDSDGEVMDIKDIAAKCRYAIDNGYGGIMAWHITGAPAATNDTIARYVSLAYTTGIAPQGKARSRQALGTPALLASPAADRHVLDYVVPSSAPGASHIALTVHRPDGSLVRNVIRGFQKAGSQRAEWLRDDASGAPVAKGNYVVRLAVNGKSSAAQTVTVR